MGCGDISPQMTGHLLPSVLPEAIKLEKNGFTDHHFYLGTLFSQAILAKKAEEETGAI